MLDGNGRRYGRIIFGDADALMRVNNPQTENARDQPPLIANHLDLVLRQIVHLQHHGQESLRAIC